MNIKVVWSVLQALALVVLRVVLILAGLVMVPLALPWRTVDLKTARPFTQAPSAEWMLITLPRWAWIWSNDRDGAAGDKRGWWHQNAPFGLGAYHWFSMLWWLAIRNPANNPRFQSLMGCPVTECTFQYWGDEVVEDRPGQAGKRFLLATNKTTGRLYGGFYGVKEWSMAGLLPGWVMSAVQVLAALRPAWFGGLPVFLAIPRAVVVQLGFKGEPSDWAEDYTGDLSRQWVGLTFEINPFKDIS